MFVGILALEMVKKHSVEEINIHVMEVLTPSSGTKLLTFELMFIVHESVV